MKIQVLYIEGCPNHRPAVELVGEVVSSLDVDATVEQIEVKGPEDSEQLRFLGSPTILVNGVDVEPAARSRTSFGFSCRTYNGAGLPSRDMVAAAVKGQDYAPGGGAAAPDTDTCCANEEDSKGASGLLVEKTGAGRWMMGASVVAAAAATACCWLPLLLITFGVSAGAIGTLFEQTRSIFLVMAVALLSAGFYFSHIRKEKCAPGSACETPNPRLKRVNRKLFWMATVAVVAFAAFPSYVGIFQASTAGAATDSRTTARAMLTLEVDGMSCEGCSVIVHNELAKVAGVLNVEVQFEAGRAFVTIDSTSPPSIESVIAAVERAGYKGRVAEL